MSGYLRMAVPMQDHSHGPEASVHGLYPETWAVAEYDALREALSVLMADIICERRRRQASRAAARDGEDIAEEARLSPQLEALINLEQIGHRARAEHHDFAV